jgi:hypothetical protein
MMKRVPVWAIVLSLALTGCQKKNIPLLSDLKMSDPSGEKQLLAGFYGIEAGQWRWTKRRFAVVLRPPRDADKNGATLTIKLFIPGSQIEKLGPVTISADIDDVTLAPETFREAGSLTYSRELPPSLTGSGFVPVVFTLDKALAPFEADGRELGAVVSEVSLESRNPLQTFHRGMNPYQSSNSPGQNR